MLLYAAATSASADPKAQYPTHPTVVAQKIASCVYRLGGAFGVAYAISVVRGEDTEKVRDRGHERLSTYGILKGATKHELREWIYQLIAQDVLVQTDDEFPVLRLGPRARDLMKGAFAVKLRQPAIKKKDPRSAGSQQSLSAGSRSDQAPLGTEDRALFEVLRKWRRVLAEQRHVPTYVIFGDRTLRELARVRPGTLTELRQIYGIGDVKLETFGRAILDQIGKAEIRR